MSASQEQLAQNDRAKRKTLLTLAAAGFLAVVLVVGAALVLANWHAASTYTPETLTRYTFGARGDDDNVANLGDALHADSWVILGYFMTLGALAVVLWRGALSEFGKLVGRQMGAAAALAALSDLAENALLRQSHERPDVGWLVTAASVAATLKWCAVVAALLAVPPALWIIVRLAWVFVIDALMRVKAASLHRTRMRWWDRVLADEDQFPADVSDDVRHAHQSTVDAYRVPGSQEVITESLEQQRPVTALCLSGGGIRSACVAMGAMQSFSKQRETANASPPPAAGGNNRQH